MVEALLRGVGVEHHKLVGTAKRGGLRFCPNCQESYQQQLELLEIIEKENNE